MLLLYLPALALLGWAVAGVLGADSNTLDIIGPALTAVACFLAAREKVRKQKERRDH